jgi:hypothetical protein
MGMPSQLGAWTPFVMARMGLAATADQVSFAVAA